jgi:hypothetical protein
MNPCSRNALSGNWRLGKAELEPGRHACAVLRVGILSPVFVAIAGA